MALLQIAEPGQSAAPHQHKLAVGIDLGTTNSLVAAVRSGVPETLKDEQGRAILPSAVHYSESEVVVGHDARDIAQQDPANSIISVKRMMGRSLADIQARYPQMPYQFSATDNGLPQLITRGGEVNPVQVSAEILKTLNQRAQDTLGR